MRCLGSADFSMQMQGMFCLFIPLCISFVFFCQLCLPSNLHFSWYDQSQTLWLRHFQLAGFLGIPSNSNYSLDPIRKHPFFKIVQTISSKLQPHSSPLPNKNYIFQPFPKRSPPVPPWTLHRQAKLPTKAAKLPKAADLRLEVKISLEKALRGPARPGRRVGTVLGRLRWNHQDMNSIYIYILHIYSIYTAYIFIYSHVIYVYVCILSTYMVCVYLNSNTYVHIVETEFNYLLWVHYIYGYLTELIGKLLETPMFFCRDFNITSWKLYQHQNISVYIYIYIN